MDSFFKKVSLISLILLPLAWIVFGQTKKTVEYKGDTFLNDKTTHSGSISVDSFIQLIQQPLWVKDKRNAAVLPVSTFTFTYAERGMYEDEKGKPFIYTDYLSSNCRAQVDTGMISELKARAKAGDTAFLDHVYYLNKELKDKIGVLSTPIKLILTK